MVGLLLPNMNNLALSTNGTKVVMASSTDEKYPPENIIDGKSDTFWTTTGMYPQCFIVAFPSTSSVDSVIISCYNVKEIRLEKSTSNEPVEFEKVGQKELTASSGSLQKDTIHSESFEAKYLRFVITSGYDHFCAVYKIQVSGTLY
ncbi:intraflagellar transport protein 25 homolog isoform X1 [Tachypleus tridentatus]|uniref:intraflagellar transport protein 25 homolog n=1 Tax=Tachypleus tridentatus TaxID=6853 RepID=UPI003FD587A4